jgi:hypothetical protein
VPDDRIVVAESGVRDAATVAGWRAVGFDAALVGEALVRSSDPRAAVAAFVEAGREAVRSGKRRQQAVREDLRRDRRRRRLAAVRAGADAVGLNLVPATRASSRSTRRSSWGGSSAPWRRAAARRASSRSPPTPARSARRDRRRARPDAVQLSATSRRR